MAQAIAPDRSSAASAARNVSAEAYGSTVRPAARSNCDSERRTASSSSTTKTSDRSLDGLSFIGRSLSHQGRQARQGEMECRAAVNAVFRPELAAMGCDDGPADG